MDTRLKCDFSCVSYEFRDFTGRVKVFHILVVVGFMGRYRLPDGVHEESEDCVPPSVFLRKRLQLDDSEQQTTVLSRRVEYDAACQDALSDAQQEPVRFHSRIFIH